MNFTLIFLLLTLAQCFVLDNGRLRRSNHEIRDDKIGLSSTRINQLYDFFNDSDITPGDAKNDSIIYSLWSPFTQAHSISYHWSFNSDGISNEKVTLVRRGSPTGRGLGKARGRSIVDPGETTKLYVVPYYRGTDLPYHWALFATNSPKDRGTVYQLKGLPGRFAYSGPERSIAVSNSIRKRKEINIGTIPNSKIEEMEAIISHVPVCNSREGYNCQTWTADVLAQLHARNWLNHQPSKIVSMLKRVEKLDLI